MDVLTVMESEMFITVCINASSDVVLSRPVSVQVSTLDDSATGELNYINKHCIVSS